MNEKPPCPRLTASTKIVFTVDLWHGGRTGIDHLAMYSEPDRIQDQHLQPAEESPRLKEPHAQCHWQPVGLDGPLGTSCSREGTGRGHPAGTVGLLVADKVSIAPWEQRAVKIYYLACKAYFLSSVLIYTGVALRSFTVSPCSLGKRLREAPDLSSL